MDLTALRAELIARGFDYLDPTGTTRQDYFLNRAYHMVNEEWEWYWTEKTTTGTAPLAIADLRQVLYVIDTTNDKGLPGIDERTTRQFDPDLTATGNPNAWYLEGTTLLVWPASTTASLAVRYYYTPPDLVAGGDIPIIPARFHYVIVDAAVYLALRDNDEWEEAHHLRGIYDRQIRSMVSTYNNRNLANPEYVTASRPWYDLNV